MTHTIHPKPLIYFSNVINVMLFSICFPDTIVIHE